MVDEDVDPSDLFDPAINLKLGCAHLSDYRRRFGSIPALERDGDHTIRARRLDGDLWETEASLL